MPVLRLAARALAVLLALVILAFAALFIAMCVANSPLYAWRVLRYGQSDSQDYLIFPDRAIQNPPQPSALESVPASIPAAVTYRYQGAQRTETLDSLLRRTNSKAFIVVQNDRVIQETYLNSTRDSINTSFSSAKSVNSALIGAAVSDGYIHSINDPVIRYVSEIAGRGLDDLTIRDLLMMNSGIRYLGNDEIPFYQAPFGDDAFTYYSPDLRKVALNVRASGTPIGAAFHYNNYHPLLEGLILERATGRHVSEYLQERLWQPMGAEFPASWSMDSDESGFEKMESGINARAIDFARFGLLFLHDGEWNGRQILPEDWVKESTEPLRPDPRRWETFPTWPALGFYYKYHWWGLNNPDGTYDFMAFGRYDQLIYVAPRKHAVIVRLGNAPDTHMLWALAIRSLVDQLP